MTPAQLSTDLDPVVHARTIYTYVALGPASPGRAACEDRALEGMMRRRALWVVLVLGLMACSAEASAILIVDSNGILQGATGVTVGDALYDVELLNGSCPEVFSGCDAASDFQFQTSGAATLAALALLDQVFLDGPQGPFDSSPEMNSGCRPQPSSPEAVCEIYVPFQVAPSFPPVFSYAAWSSVAYNRKASTDSVVSMAYTNIETESDSLSPTACCGLRTIPKIHACARARDPRARWDGPRGDGVGAPPSARLTPGAGTQRALPLPLCLDPLCFDFRCKPLQGASRLDTSRKLALRVLLRALGENRVSLLTIVLR